MTLVLVNGWSMRKVYKADIDTNITAECSIRLDGTHPVNKPPRYINYV